VPQSDFDLPTSWARARDEFESTRPSVDVTVRLKRSTLPALRRAVDCSVRQAVREGRRVPGVGRVELVLPFERLDFAYADLIKLAGPVEVVAPAEFAPAAGRRRALASGDLRSRDGL
jgi:hypothetical protein